MENKHDLQELLEEYFDDCKNRRRLSDLTVKAYRIDLTQYSDFIGNDMHEYKRITEFIHYLNKRYSKGKTIKRKIASIKAFYAYLASEEIIEISPFNKIKTKLKEETILPRTISNHIIAQILTYIYSEKNKIDSVFEYNIIVRNIAMIEVLLTTGVRISEVCGIKQENLDLDEKTIKIMGKGSKERILYLGSESVMNILREYCSIYRQELLQSDYLFLNKYGNRISEQSIRLFLKHIEQELALSSHITPHMFRHTFATMLLEKDVDIRYIQKILGHSSISVTQIYTHVTNTKQKEILLTKNPRNDYQIKES